MKKYLKQFPIFLIALLLIMNLCTYAYTATPISKYKADPNFKFDDEIIAHALKASVVRIFNISSASIRYKPVTFNSDKLEEDFISLCDEFGNTYSEEEIALTLIEYMEENIIDYLHYSSEKEVQVEGGGSGSGVVISDDGYIATNAHVATLSEDEKKQMYISSLQEDILNDVKQIKDDVEQYNVTLSEEQIYELFELICTEAAEEVTILNEDSRLEVYFPSPTGDVDMASATRYDAQIVEIGTSEGLDGLTEDTAILKINANNLIALKLSDSYPNENSTIVSAGFPVAADEIFKAMGSNESELSINVGTGKIARIAPVSGSIYQAIGITTTITGGNSGGPSVDQNLNIEGLNTYGTKDNQYVYMIPAEFVADLSNNCNITQGEASQTFLIGLQMLQQNYGSSALECFERVQMLQPRTPYITKMIDQAKQIPQEEHPDAASSLSSVLFIILGILVLIIVIVIIIIVIFSRRSRKKRNNYYTNSYNNSLGGTNYNNFNNYNGSSGSSRNNNTWL